MKETEPAEHVERVEPTDPMEPMEPVELMERSGAVPHGETEPQCPPVPPVPRFPPSLNQSTMNKKRKNNQNLIEAVLNPPHVSCRCGAKARSTGEPCKRWASIGYKRCKFHGGAKGSGRPKTHGKFSAQEKRNAQFLRLAKYLLRSTYRKPGPVDV